MGICFSEAEEHHNHSHSHKDKHNKHNKHQVHVAHIIDPSRKTSLCKDEQQMRQIIFDIFDEYDSNKNEVL